MGFSRFDLDWTTWLAIWDPAFTTTMPRAGPTTFFGTIKIIKANQHTFLGKLQILFTTHFQVFSLYFHTLLLRTFWYPMVLFLKETLLVSLRYFKINRTLLGVGSEPSFYLCTITNKCNICVFFIVPYKINSLYYI